MARRLHLTGISFVGVLGVVLCGFAASFVGAFSDDHPAGAAFTAITATSGVIINDDENDVDDELEETIAIDDVPAAVRLAIELHARGGTVQEVERSVHQGMTVYEVDYSTDTGSFELAFDEHGNELGLQDEIDDGDDDADEDDSDDDEGDDEIAITLNDLPDVVRQRLAKFTGEDAVTEVSMKLDDDDDDEADDGDRDGDDADEVIYEVEYNGKSGNASVIMSGNGEVIAVKNAVSQKTLPEAVLIELLEEFPGAAITEAEAVQVFYYEVELMIDGKPVDVTIFANGEMDDDDEEQDEDEEENDVDDD